MSSAFISSTNEDLACREDERRDYRMAARDAAIRAGYLPKMQEYFAAGNNPPLRVCLEEVQRADLLIVLVAHRYGWVPEDQPGTERKSITWLECEEAIKHHKPVLAFLIEDRYEWPLERKEEYQFTVAGMEGKSAELGPVIRHNIQRLGAFKDWLRERGVCSFFTTPDDLKSKVQHALEKVGTAAPPAAPAQELIINLPFLGAGKSFRDREREIGKLHEHLHDPDTRFVAVVGPMGVGKTALISKLCETIKQGELRISRTSKTMGADGIVYFVCRRDDRQTAERLFHNIRRLLAEAQSKEASDYWSDGNRNEEEKFEYLLDKLPADRYLVAVDNFEEVIDERTNQFTDKSLATFLNVCLTRDHPLRIVATSRKSVPVTVNVKQLELTEGLPEKEAIAYLRDLDPEGYLELEELPAEVLQKTVQLCGGNPSVLQLVVGKLRQDETVTLPSLLKNTSLFTDLGGLIAEQYDGQSADRKRVLEALAVFRDPVPNHAVSHVVDAFSMAVNVGPCLSELRRIYIVHRGEKRGIFALQPGFQEYAYAQIPDEPEGPDGYCKRSCHAVAADYYQMQRKDPGQWRAIEDLQPQLEEFRHRIRAEQYDDAARLLDTVDDEYLQRWGHYRRVISLREQLLQKLTDKNLVVSNLGNLGLVYRRTGRIRDSIAVFEDAIQRAHQDENSWAEGRWSIELANTYADFLKMSKARELYEQAVEIARSKKHDDVEARAIGNLGILHRQLAEFELAIACYEQAIQIDQRINDRRWEAIHGGNLGRSYYALGDYDQALACYQSSLQICQEVREKYQHTVDIYHMGEASIAKGELAHGRQQCEESAHTFQSMEESRMRSYALETLGLVSYLLGDKGKARSCYEEGLQLDVPETSYRLTGRLGILSLDDSDAAEAARRLQAAEESCAEIVVKEPRFYEAACFLALVQLASRKTKEALAAYRRALEVTRARGVMEDALRDLGSLARAAPQMPGIDEVRRLLLEAIG